MAIGKISAFDVKTGLWSSYADRLEMYFKVNKIEEDLKLATLISVMGDEAYELLVNLASPKKPAELTYAVTRELMSRHLQPIPSVLAERYRFRQRRQRAEENISDYVAELKKLARYCKFKENLTENLRDQFVCGLKGDVIRQRLFAEDGDISFVDAVKLATSLEAAERDAAAVESRSGLEAAGADVHAMQARGARAGPARQPARQPARTGAGTARAGTRRDTPAPGQAASCRACGASGHSYVDCRFRSYVCSRCKRPGHLRRMCSVDGARPSGTAAAAAATADAAAAGPSYAGNRRGFHYAGDFTADEDNGGASDGEFEDAFLDLHQLSLRDYKPVCLPINIDGTIISMEIDTGTPISCISKYTYDRYFRTRTIHPYDLCLRFYDGSNIRPLGYIKPSVIYKDKVKELELFVIDQGTTSLLGRQWLSELQIEIPSLNCLQRDSGNGNGINNNINALVDRYKQLFDGSLGRFTGGKATLRVREGAAPVFHRARPLPFALRERVDAELDAMLRAGIIEPVECSDWASPLVPVNKSDGTLRICVDYKATLNPVLLIDRYPLPRIDDVLVALNGAQYFSKIDLSQSYNQIELDESKNYTIINTHRGLFRYNRLVFGLSSSPGIFQRIMTNLLIGIPNVAVFIDDVIIGGKTESEHLKALETVFRRLLDSGLRLKKSKCVFLEQEVSYLGYILSKEGLKADPAKIAAVAEIPRPQNVPELRSFLGLANFFAKFVKNYSHKLIPLYNLLRKTVPWHWSHDCEEAFKGIKTTLTGSQVLAHYEPSKQLIVTCDASAAGVGGVLSQPDREGRERPVAFVSRTLTSAEKNYSQIHREALAIIYCMRKFHQYIYGRRFVLRTDHKPLVSIFGPNTGIPVMTASRMQRWAIMLSAYSYDIEYVRTDANSADGLSRLPLLVKEPVSRAVPEQTYLHFAQEAFLLDYNEIKRSTARDPILSRLLAFIRDGWPAQCEIVGMQPYFNRRTELYEELGCVMWGHRVLIPANCRDKVLSVLHEPHMGIVKSKSIARSYVWWAGIDEAIEAMCRGCETCAAQADAPPRQAPRPWPWPSRPWSRLHLDFMGPIYGKMYLVVVDAMSKWLEVFVVPSTAATSTIDKLNELWSRWGLPKQIVTDNGPPFTSKEFEAFVQTRAIEHILTAPYHPASNGAAENAVKTLKRVIKKAVFEKKNVMQALNTFLLYYRNTEHSSTGESPAMLLQGRRLRTRLDALKPNRESKVIQSQRRQLDNAGGGSRTIDSGDSVWYRQYLKSEKWLPGKVESCMGPSNFKVIGEEGNRVHRHIDQLKPRSRSSLIFPNPECATVSSPEVQTDNDIFLDAEEREGETDRVPVLMVPEGRNNTQLELTGAQHGGSMPSSPARVPEPTEPILDAPQNVHSASKPPRPFRQCKLIKPNYKL